MREKKKTTFESGRLVATHGVIERVSSEDIVLGLRRHLACDWGEVCEEDKELNDYAVKKGNRIHSAYLSKDGVRFWIITEADRSATTVLLPDEY